MNIVPFNRKSHYQSIVNVWKYHKCDPYPPVDCLPRIGYVVEDDNGQFIAALFMYLIQNEAAFIDWGVSNYLVAKDIRKEAFRMLMSKAKFRALSAGAKFMYSITKVKPFAETLQLNGMVVAEKGMTTYVMPLMHGDVSFIQD